MVTTTHGAVSLRVAAPLLGIHYRTLKRYAAQQRLPTYWSGKTEMVTMDTVARILAGELSLHPPTDRPRDTRIRDARGRFARGERQDGRTQASGTGTTVVERAQ